MRIDCHQHFWDYRPSEYPWMQGEGMEALRRNHGPGDLEALLRESRMEGSVAVQARQSLEETEWLLRLSDRHARIRGVVGWVDLQDPEVEETLERCSRHPRMVGVRHVVQDEPDPGFLLRPAFLRGLSKLHGYGLAYDLLLYPRQLPAAIELAERLPDQRFVLDHMAKPLIGQGILAPWYRDLARLAGFPHVSCKLSGMVTEASWGQWKPRDFRPYLDVAWDAFGEDRLMFGSDWPVCLLSASYREVVRLVEDFLEKFDPPVRAKVMGGNAAAFYGLEPFADKPGA